MLKSWDIAHETPRDRLYAYADMMVQLKEDIYKHGCPIGSACSELIKMGNINQTNATDMIVLFRDWITKQIIELEYKKQKADQLALHLISRTQGISLMANAFEDKSFLMREVDQLKEWIRRL